MGNKYFEKLISIPNTVLKYLFALGVFMSAISSLAQTKGRTVARELQRFKDAGAVIMSSDTELVNLFKTYVDFGEVYTVEEVDTHEFRGFYICEYAAMDYYNTIVTDYYLLATSRVIHPGQWSRTLADTRACVGILLNNTLREKLPLYLIAFNNLLHLSYKVNQDVSVNPLENSMATAIGRKVLELKNLKLLVMESELVNSFVKKPSMLARIYPYAYEVTDLYEGIKAVKEQKPGYALVFTNFARMFMSIYVIRCDTHELLYGWSEAKEGREMNAADFLMIAKAIKNEGG